MPRNRETNLDLLVKLPWWVSAGLGVLSYGLVRWGIPIWAVNDVVRVNMAKILVPLAPLAFLLFGPIAILSFWFSKHRGKLVDQQDSLASLQAISWKDFEYMVAEAFRRQGYQVEYSVEGGPDGGVDLTLHKEGRISLVQCKRWKTQSVSVSVVREMFGLMAAEKAHEAIIVTSGGFTADAVEFSAGKAIRLIGGPELLALIQSVQPAQLSSKPQAEQQSSSEIPDCPVCGKPMVRRTARRGGNAGNQFWGCSAYPNCKGIVN